MVLGDPADDALVGPLLRALSERTSTVRLVRTSDWARTPVSIHDDVRVDRAHVDVFIDRSGSLNRFAGSFRVEDAAFAEAEARATLLAVLSHRGLRAVNRAEPRWWFAPHPWPALRTVLAASGVEVTPMRVGRSRRAAAPHADSRWLTWSGVDVRTPPPAACATLLPALVPAVTTTSLWCHGRVVVGSQHANTRRAVDVLGRRGIQLLSVTTDADDRIVMVEPRPVVPEGVTATVAAELAGRVADAAVRR